MKEEEEVEQKRKRKRMRRQEDGGIIEKWTKEVEEIR